MKAIAHKKSWALAVAVVAATLLTLAGCGGSSPGDAAPAAGSPFATASAPTSTPAPASSAAPVASAAPASNATPDAGGSTPAGTPTVAAGDGGSRIPLSTPTATASASGAGGGGSGGGPTGSPGTPRSTPPLRAAAAIVGFAFSPPTLTIKVGTKVTWTNNDASPHTITSTDGPSTSAKTTGSFDSGAVNRGQSFSFTFDKAGTYYYECTFHASMPTMHATVIVR
jgi:plastocyanin